MYFSVETSACGANAVALATVGSSVDEATPVTGVVTGGGSTSGDGTFRDAVDVKIDGRWAVVDYVVVAHCRCSETNGDDHGEKEGKPEHRGERLGCWEGEKGKRMGFYVHLSSPCGTFDICS